MEYLVETGNLSVMEKLSILTDAAKYDVACTSSGVDRRGKAGMLGNCVAAGICHSFAGDGRCISLLKILLTNECIYDCKYCLNRRSNDVPRATFTPEEICDLTIQFYRRNYIEGLFLSSGIVESPTFTMELIRRTVYLLRTKYGFNGYVHVKAIPGADSEVIRQTGFLVDRMSVNLELPTADGLRNLAPNKHRKNILTPMRQIQNGITQSRNEVAVYLHAPSFVGGGQSTQMIVGATNENDFQILNVAESLYQKFELKRVFYSAFVRVNEDKSLPVLPGGPPLLREHRLYQADWLLRFYGFRAQELLNERRPFFNVMLDPKEDWAVGHLEQFPVEINRAPYEKLLRVPGIGMQSARRIVAARRSCNLNFENLKRLGVVLKRALYFITCSGKMMYPTKLEEDYIVRQLTEKEQRIRFGSDGMTYRQMSLFDDESFAGEAGSISVQEKWQTTMGQL
ncbi:MAG: putative DNA modification/repair radical SAM protein [Lachnospiraceae bacterium]|nr:putative DNA modification/repair radical SAM protein [Lachnospiraceae bacterium]